MTSKRNTFPTFHPVTGTTDRKARANASHRLGKLERLEAKLEMRQYRNTNSGHTNA